MMNVELDISERLSQFIRNDDVCKSLRGLSKKLKIVSLNIMT